MTTSTNALRCARCQKLMPPGDAQEVAVEQGTSSSQLYIHLSDCRGTDEPPRRVLH